MKRRKTANEFLLYALFGFIASLLNIGSYYILYNLFGIGNELAVFISYLIAFIFGFITNKFLVFLSDSKSAGVIAAEAIKFTSVRTLTCVVDLIFMHITVTIAAMNPTVMKFISNIIVGLINFILSHFFVFGKNKEGLR